MTKYIEINGTRYDLNGDGFAPIGDGPWLSPSVISALGLEIKEDRPKWTIERNGYTYAYQPRSRAPLHITDYATGLKELASFAGAFPSEAFELRKDGVTVATLKGENA